MLFQKIKSIISSCLLYVHKEKDYPEIIKTNITKLFI